MLSVTRSVAEAVEDCCPALELPVAVVLLKLTSAAAEACLQS